MVLLLEAAVQGIKDECRTYYIDVNDYYKN